MRRPSRREVLPLVPLTRSNVRERCLFGAASASAASARGGGAVY